MAFVCENISVNEEGVLTFAGQSTEELARQYGTPLYLMDEDRIRQNCRTYVNAFSEHFPEGSMPLFAGKACCFKQIYRIISSENMGCDVVSSGEIFTASEAGMDMEKAFFHGNNKTDADIKFAMDRGVGYFVADNEEEILAIEAEAAARGIVQKVLLRITPGIDPHTYEAVSTGKVDSKFGQAIATGQAEEITALTLRQEHVELAGFHCHVGSQVFAEDVFERASDVMLEFIADMNAKFGYMAGCLNLGGGYGVRYVDSDPYLYIAEKIGSVAGAIKRKCESLDIPVPVICMEPGRSIVADAGMTLYTAGSVKKIPGYKNYVSVDGGMTDNPRYALYEAGKNVEIFEYYDPSLRLIGEWCKQSFGESEGKEGKGLFPASLTFSTDLHSMGQFLQEGHQIFFETVINVMNRNEDVRIPESAGSELAGRSLNDINAMAVKGVMKAHAKAGIPMIRIDVEEMSEDSLGQLLYFFMMSAAVTGKLMGIDPFNQPGVEDYKQEIRNLLGQQ